MRSIPLRLVKIHILCLLITLALVKVWCMVVVVQVKVIEWEEESLHV